MKFTQPLSMIWGKYLFLLSIPVVVAILLLLSTTASSSAVPTSRVWGSKPLLSHILLTGKSTKSLFHQLRLNHNQVFLLQRLAWQEEQQLLALEQESLPIITDPSLNHQEKTNRIQVMGYNQRLIAIIDANQRIMRLYLGADNYRRFVSWIEANWNEDRKMHSMPEPIALPPGSEPFQRKYPRSFEVWATRYDSGDRYVVALPDKCLKFANAGAMLCNNGYQYNQEYSVAISYKGNIVVAPVLESGPWNIDDNYWATVNDPQPRRMFADLPLGMPEAQAAYYNGYNGGLDQFGRLVKSPVAIDISWVVAKDLDLPPGNSKVTISFLWTEGWDQPASSQPDDNGTDNQVAPAVSAITWTTSTPRPDGAVIHIVQSGQTLAGIATVYGVPLEEILSLNDLQLESIIQPGDQVVVFAPSPTPTFTAIASATARQTHTPPASPTPSPTEARISTSTPPPVPAQDGGINAVDFLLFTLVIFALALVIVILSSSRSYPKNDTKS